MGAVGEIKLGKLGYPVTTTIITILPGTTRHQILSTSLVYVAPLA